MAKNRIPALLYKQARLTLPILGILRTLVLKSDAQQKKLASSEFNVKKNLKFVHCTSIQHPH